MNYEVDIEIDEDALDVECLNQGVLAIKYARHFVEKKTACDAVVEEIKVIRAELIAEVNTNPMACCKKEKPTVADVEAYYRTHKTHKEAKARWLVAQEEMEIAGLAKNEICFTRKAMLEALITLHGQQYFAGPRVPRDLSAEKRQKEKDSKEVNAGIGKKMMRKKE